MPAFRWKAVIQAILLLYNEFLHNSELSVNCNCGQMIFCPLCHCLLLVQKSMNQMLFICYSCPYFYPVFEKVNKKTVFSNPLEDEIFGESKTDTMEGRRG